MNDVRLNFFLISVGIFLAILPVSACAENFLSATQGTHDVSTEKVLEIGMTDLQNSVEQAKGKNTQLSSENKILDNRISGLQKKINVLEEEKNKLLLEINQANTLGDQLQKNRAQLDEQQSTLKKILDNKKGGLAKIQKTVETLRESMNHVFQKVRAHVFRIVP